MNTEYLDAGDPGAVARAAQWLRLGEVIVFPTDTLYGIGVDAFNAAALTRLYNVKQRSLEKGIPVLLSDPADLSRVASEVPPLAQELAGRFWPGPLTLIVPRHESLPENLSPNENVAVRIPDHELARGLIRAAGGAVATSSANLSGERPALDASEAFEFFNGRVAAVLDDGPVQYGEPSTVLDCTTMPPRVLRQGPIPAESLFPKPT